MCTRRFLQFPLRRWAWGAAFLNRIQCGHRGAWRWTHSRGSTYKAVIFDMGGVLIPSPGTVAAEWEVQNRIPSGTVLKALVRGGETGPWMRFMRGETTREDFLQEFGNCCSEMVVESCLEGICKPDPRIYQLCLQRLGLQPSQSIFLDDLGQNLKAAASLGIHTIKVRDPETAVQELETLLGFPLRPGIRNTRAVRRTMEIPRGPLEKYLKDLLGTQSTAGPLELLQFDHGQSNPTYYIRLHGHQLVLRKKPPGTLLPSAHAIEREFSVIGTPFYLMEYCPGHVYKDPSLPGLEPSQRRAIYTAMNRVLCKIHSVDPQAAGLEDYGKQGDYIARQVQTWTRQYRASETSTIAAM